MLLTAMQRLKVRSSSSCPNRSNNSIARPEVAPKKQTR
jgi:hypothetical protein